jgi:hypothetical protein
VLIEALRQPFLLVHRHIPPSRRVIAMTHETPPM